MKKYLEKYKYILFILVLVVLEAFYFRDVLINHNLFGDVGDGKFCNITAEHWFQFLKGNDSFTEMRMFFPVKGTIAYSDMLLFYAVPYCLLRFFGLNMFLSYKYVIIALHVAGMAVFSYFLRKKLKLGYPSVLIGAIIFGYSNPFVTSSHTQLFGYFLVPFVLLFAWNFFVSMENRKKRIINGVLAVVFFDGLFYTSFYIGYFLAVLLLIFLIMLAVVFKLRGEKIIKTVITYLKKNIKVLYKYALLAVVLLVPFLCLELPVVREFGTRSWSEVTVYLPVLSDVLNVHMGNIINGGNVEQTVRSQNAEVCQGFPLIILLAVVAGIVLYAKKCIADRKKGGTVSALYNRRTIYLAVALSFAMGIILVPQFRQDMSLWYLVYKFIPGGSAIRAAGRFFQMLCIPAAVFLAEASDELLRRKRSMIITMAVVTVILVQYVWRGTIADDWNEDNCILTVSEIPEPPEDCEVMYIKNIQIDEEIGGELSCISASMDASLIAERFGLGCINGYSGLFPKNFNFGLWITMDEYEASIENWIQIHNLEHVYAYDVTERKWVKD